MPGSAFDRDARQLDVLDSDHQNFAFRARLT